jgi:indole-3-glycerol phosphate synthase
VAASILEQIITAKREEISRRQSETPRAALEERIEGRPTPLNLSGALMGDGVRLIAEVKKSSPSRGLLRADFDPAAIARAYAENGAAAISVLTDDHFQGRLEHLPAVRDAVAGLGTPVLRKDFIIDPYQVFESRAWGADAILLIVAALEPALLKELLGLARSLWLQCLVEVHDEAELETALEVGAEIVGINNRDLHTFQTDLAVTEALAPRVPRGRVVVSESGIAGAEDLRRLRPFGVHAVLVGEALVTVPDVGSAVRALLGRKSPILDIGDRDG